MSPLLAQSGHRNRAEPCPLSGVKQTSGLERVAMIFNPNTAPGRGGTYYLRDFEAAARSFNFKLIAAEARSDADVETVVTSLGGEPLGGLVVTPDYFMFNRTEQIASLAARNNVPTIYPWKPVVVKQGGLLSYGPDLVDIHRRSASIVSMRLVSSGPVLTMVFSYIAAARQTTRKCQAGCLISYGVDQHAQARRAAVYVVATKRSATFAAIASGPAQQ